MGYVMAGKLNLLMLCCILIFVPGCKTWLTLEYETDGRPIQVGPHRTSAEMDTLGLVRGFTEHESVEDSYSESERISVTFHGGEYYESNIDSTIYQSLRDHPEHFIADSEFRVEVKYGVSFGSFLSSVVAGWITGEESTAGNFTLKKIRQYGIVYRYKKDSEEPE